MKCEVCGHDSEHHDVLGICHYVPFFEGMDIYVPCHCENGPTNDEGMS